MVFSPSIPEVLLNFMLKVQHFSKLRCTTKPAVATMILTAFVGCSRCFGITATKKAIITSYCIVKHLILLKIFKKHIINTAFVSFYSCSISAVLYFKTLFG